MDAEYLNIAGSLDALLGSIDLSSTDEEGSSQPLPDGYYLAEVQKASLGQSKKGNPMVTISYKTVGNGKKLVTNEEGYTELEEAPRSADRFINCYYVLTNEMNVGMFVSDMLKFQDLETDESFFDKEEDFKDTEAIVRLCEKLQEGGVIYLMLQTVQKDGKTDQKKKPISWKRARKLELI